MSNAFNVSSDAMYPRFGGISMVAFLSFCGEHGVNKYALHSSSTSISLVVTNLVTD